MDKYLTIVVLVSLVLAVRSDTADTKRANSCGTRAGRQNNKCRSNVSFMKRIYDAYKRGGVETDAEGRGLDDIEGEREAEQVEKLRLLKELLNELDLYGNDMN